MNAPRSYHHAASVAACAALCTLAVTLPLAGCGGVPADQTAQTAFARLIEIGDDELTLLAPEDLTIECDADTNPAALREWLQSASAESACEGAALENDFASLSDDCGSTGAATVTWTATDECDNTATHTATFTIEDTTAPTINGPEDIELPGGPNLRQEIRRWLDSAEATDACGEVTITNDFETLGGDGCGATGSTTVTWTATDDCGNTSTHAATLTVIDNRPPRIAGPADMEIACGRENVREALNQWLDSASAEDFCGDVELTNDFTSLSDECGQTGAATVTWTAVDACGNEATHTAIFTVVDNADPSIDGPDDLAVECGTPDVRQTLNRWLESATATDACGAVTLTDDFERLSDDCGQTGAAEVTWLAEDDCGNTATHTAEFAVIDTTAPVLTVPGDLLGLCADGGDLSDIRRWLNAATADDACGAVDLESSFSGLSAACDGTATWTATDACRNRVSASAMVTVEDDIPPEITINGRPEMTLECGIDEYNEPGAAVADACDVTLTMAEVGGDTVDTGNTGTYTVLYDAADACGNMAEQRMRTVEVVDTLPPGAPDEVATELWPPNHNYRTLTLADCGVRDACEEDLDVNAVGQIISIYSDEPQNANGDGNTIDDVVILDHSTFMVRVERQGGGNGRVYGVTFEISDSAGNMGIDTCFVGVPHDQSGAPAIDDGPAYTVKP